MAAAQCRPRYTGYWGSLTSPSTRTPAQTLGGKVVSCVVIVMVYLYRVNFHFLTLKKSEFVQKPVCPIFQSKVTFTFPQEKCTSIDA